MTARLQAVAPALAALELSAHCTGSAARSAGTLLPPDEVVRCSFAKHTGFGEDFAALSMPQLRRLQRGHRAAVACLPVAGQPLTELFAAVALEDLPVGRSDSSHSIPPTSEHMPPVHGVLTAEYLVACAMPAASAMPPVLDVVRADFVELLFEMKEVSAVTTYEDEKILLSKENQQQLSLHIAALTKAAAASCSRSRSSSSSCSSPAVAPAAVVLAAKAKNEDAKVSLSNDDQLSKENQQQLSLHIAALTKGAAASCSRSRSSSRSSSCSSPAVDKPPMRLFKCDPEDTLAFVYIPGSSQSSRVLRQISARPMLPSS